MSLLEKPLDKLQDFVVDRWHTKSGLALAIGLVFVIGVSFFVEIDVTKVPRYGWLLIALAIAAVALTWLKTRLPRATKDRLGFGVAISFESDDQAKRLQADLVDALRRLVTASNHSPRFEFLSYPNVVAERAKDSTHAEWLLRKSNLKFLIYGRARQRPSAQGEAYYVDLSWMVAHAPISIETSRELSQSTFVNQLVIATTATPGVWEIGVQLIDGFARGIVGVAAAISGDLEYGEALLLQAESRLRALESQPNAPPLLSNVRSRLVQVHSQQIINASQSFTKERQQSDLERMEACAQKLLEYDPGNVLGHQTLAIAAFLLRRDIAAARRSLSACQAYDDASLIYSDAFLHGYEGDLDKAYRAYRNAVKAPLSDASVPIQCEEFIQYVLDSEPEKYWLYFCLGLLNSRCKNDAEAATRDFEIFVARDIEKQFAKQVEIVVTKWLPDLKKGICQTN
jgi:hypothetical protein